MDDRFTDFIFDRDVFSSYRIELDLHKCSFAYWHGQILHNDFLEISGLAGCLGIVCIETHPTLEPLSNKPIRQTISQRTSIPSVMKSMFPGRSSIRNSNIHKLSHPSHSSNRISNNGSRTSTHGKILSHAAFMMHDMSRGHFLAKDKLKNIFKKYPDKKSLKIFYYCTTDYGQLDWLIQERGGDNIQAGGLKPDSDDAQKSYGFCSLLASPSEKWRITEYRHGTKNARAQLPKRRLSEKDGIEIIRQDKIGQYDWLLKENLRTLRLTSENRHNLNKCEICKTNIDSKFKSMFKRNTTSRHHCRACAKSVCGNCCTDLNTLRRSVEMNFIADDGLNSYICKNCNRLRW